jgi:hypothetical protein
VWACMCRTCLHSDICRCMYTCSAA